MRHTLILAGLALTGAVATPPDARAQNATEPAAIQVVPMTVSETRSRELREQRQPVYSGMPELTLLLEISGPGVDTATHFGKVQFDTAVDDAGTDLKPTEEEFSHQPEFREVHRPFPLQGLADLAELPPEVRAALEAAGVPLPGAQGKPPNSVTVPLELKISAREAKTIKHLKGQLQLLAGGEKRTIQVNDLAAKQGKPVEDPALKEAGVTVRLPSPDDEAARFGMPAGVEGMTLAVRGNATAVTDARIVDADGEPVGMGWAGFEHEGETLRGFHLSRPLEPTDRLELDVVVGQETITVPFDLRDVPLP